MVRPRTRFLHLLLVPLLLAAPLAGCLGQIDPDYCNPGPWQVRVVDPALYGGLPGERTTRGNWSLTVHEPQGVALNASDVTHGWARNATWRSVSYAPAMEPHLVLDVEGPDRARVTAIVPRGVDADRERIEASARVLLSNVTHANASTVAGWARELPEQPGGNRSAHELEVRANLTLEPLLAHHDNASIALDPHPRKLGTLQLLAGNWTVEVDRPWKGIVGSVNGTSGRLQVGSSNVSALTVQAAEAPTRAMMQAWYEAARSAFDIPGDPGNVTEVRSFGSDCR